MINDLSTKITITGTIKSGYTAAKIKCSCGDNIAFKKDNFFYCRGCNSIVQPESDKTFPYTTSYFIVPPEVASVYGDKPVEITVIPAYNDLERTFHASFKKVNFSGKVVCRGDGKTARRLDDNSGEEKTIKCDGEYCEDFANKKCRYYGSFVFFIPDVDVLNAYRFVTHSRTTIENIFSTLKRISKDKQVLQLPCRLRIKEVTSRKGQRFTIVELYPPAVPAMHIEQLFNTTKSPFLNCKHMQLAVPYEQDKNNHFSNKDSEKDIVNESESLDSTKRKILIDTITYLKREPDDIHIKALIAYIRNKKPMPIAEMTEEEMKDICRKLFRDKAEQYKYFVLCEQHTIAGQAKTP